MKIAFIVFNGITWFDFIGIYDPISRLKSLNYIPDLTWDICSFTEIVSDNFGVEIKPDKIQTSLKGYDVIIIPGGIGTRKLQFDDEFINWIKTSENKTHKISICTGSLILGAAGFLKDKKATTNYQEYEALKPYCKEVLEDRIVEDDNVITAGAVSASIDTGLYLCEKWAGEAARDDIRKRIDYFGYFFAFASAN
jgi:transcriptional regulator GlxA family with amidase domain